MAQIFDVYENVELSREVVYRPPGMVFNLEMANYDCPWDKNYPEGPQRYMSVLNRINELGLGLKMSQVQSRKATEDEIRKCHTQEILEELKKTAGSSDLESLEMQSSKYDAIYLHPNAYEAALYAAGSTIELVDQICAGTIPSGFALVRPPGHHAMVNEFCGYCFFNNAALAATHAMDKYGVSKILIVDWDVHHGQATQQMFYEDNRVLYFSIHRYEHGTFWPNLRESDFDHVGKEAGTGYNFNVPLNKTGMTDTDYMAIFHHILLPVACEFQPELIIISAGFDAAIGCPEGEMKITPACYAHLLWSLKNLARGMLAVVLEGGYCLKSLAEGAALTVRSLIGEPCPTIGPLGTPCPEVLETINDLMHSHSQFWDCLEQANKLRKARLDEDAADQVHCPIVKFLHTDAKPTSYATRDCYPVQSREFLDGVDLMLDTLRKNTQLSFAPNKVCFVYDEKMMLHDPGRHLRTQHPEDPNRIARVYGKFEEFGIITRCKRLESRSITEQELVMVHQADYIQFVKDVCNSSPEKQRAVERDLVSISFCKHSFDSARLATGCLLEVVDEVMSGKSQSGVAIIRPPGHHAYPAKALGFCFINNVAVAARYAQTKYNLDRILILDWDVHHGNGTQDIFYDDPSVLYISLHVYANKKFFPNLECSSASYAGSGKGKGFNVNIPWNKFGVGDSDYLAAFHAVVLPIAYQFDPQLVIVSAGFDAAIHDRIGKCLVSPEAFGHLTHYLSALANGKVILALEGGYNQESIAVSLVCCTKTLLGDPLPLLSSTRKTLKEVEAIRNVISVQKLYWPCLQFPTTVGNVADVLNDLGPVSLVVDDAVGPCDLVGETENLSENMETEFTRQEQASSMEESAAGDFQKESYSASGQNQPMDEKCLEPLEFDTSQFVGQNSAGGNLYSLERLEAAHAACLLTEPLEFDTSQFVGPNSAGGNLYSLERLEAAHAACLLTENSEGVPIVEEDDEAGRIAVFSSTNLETGACLDVPLEEIGDKNDRRDVFSLESLEAIHVAFMNDPMSRPCRSKDIVKMPEESNEIGCTSANCDEICAWRCDNCFTEFCNYCKNDHCR